MALPMPTGSGSVNDQCPESWQCQNAFLEVSAGRPTAGRDDSENAWMARSESKLTKNWMRSIFFSSG
jgi:hypothetical protein